MTKRYKILFSEQAPTRYFTSFCRMAELLPILALLETDNVEKAKEIIQNAINRIDSKQ